MGRAVSFVNDRAVEVEREKLLDLKDHSDLSQNDRPGIRTEPFTPKRPSDFLPTLRDVINSVLFCGVTVFGITLISNAIPNIGWRNKPQAGHGSHSTISTPMGMCQASTHNTNLSMDFTDPKKFSFTQMSQELLGHSDQISNLVRTTGSIEIRNTDKSSGSYVHVDLDIRGSDRRLTSSEALGIAKTDSSLVVKTPKELPSAVTTDGASDAPCLYVSAIITLSSGARLENLGIKSETIPVVFHPGLDYAESRVVDTKMHFDSTSTYSRETIIDVGSTSVTGSYPLYDLLSIHTSSGSINVDIVPKNASRQNVKPAVLRLSSYSGSIRASTSTLSVPDRDYQTSISTSSGSIDARILHGLRTSLRSLNGRITADLYPYGHNDSKTDVEVHDTSGRMDITVHSSLSHPTAPLRKLYGYYRGVSGSLTLFYPAQWQGTVEGTILSGSVDLDWQGLKVVQDGRQGHVSRVIKAVRGEGEGKLEFHETSGRLQLSGASGGL